uniref:Glycosyltransferase n=1 Tax=Auxenochlorella protothecoides TaxID=3075 RepID=A0A1D2A1T0_AUXPR
MASHCHPSVVPKLAFLLSICHCVTCYVIVGHAMPWMTSHQLQVGVMGKELVARGHTFIMLLSSCDAATLARVGGVPEGIQVMEYPSPMPSHSSCAAAKQATLLEFSTKLPGLDIWYLTEHSMVPHCAALLRNLTIIPALRALHPDLVLGDFSDVCTPILGDGLGVPRVDFSPAGFFDNILATAYNFSAPPSLVPMYGTGFVPGQLRLPWNYLLNAASFAVSPWVVRFLEWQFGDSLRAQFPLAVRRSAHVAAGDAALLLINTHTALEFERPALPPHVRLVGPLLAEPASPLPPHLHRLVHGPEEDSDAEAPPILPSLYVSFGSLFTLTMTLDQLRGLHAVLASLPARVLWKLEAGDVPGPDGAAFLAGLPPLPHGGALLGWVPQNDVLGSGGVRAFLTHGGINGVTQSLYHGVPMLILPFAGDQLDNARRVEALGAGVKLGRAGFVKRQAELHAALMRVLTEDGFKQAAVRVSRELRGGPTPGRVLAADAVLEALGSLALAAAA